MKILGIILGVLLGALAGAGAMHQWLMPQVVEARAAATELESKLAALESSTSDSTQRIASLEAERNAMSERLAALQDNPAPVQPAEVTAATNDESVDATVETAESPAEVAQAPEEGDARRGDRGGRGDRWGGTPEEREARRQEFATRMQENMSNFFTGELEKSGTPEMQERLVTLEQKTMEMMDIRSQMRDAQTEEEREALGRAFGETMQEARDIMREQQGDMLDAIASQFGITKDTDQEAFQQAVRSAMESPFFSDNPGALVWSANQQANGDGGDGPPFRGFGGFGGAGPRR